MDALSVAVTRGELVESRHRVHAVVVKGGEVLEAWGDPQLVAYVRSSAKPLQALPLVEHDLPAEELAIACASHEARPEQLVAVRALLERAGAATEDLECGSERGSRLRHSCSGKHAGFLFLCHARGWRSKGYRLPEHPLQQELLALVAETAGRPADEISTATDGCGVPTFALSLTELAHMFAGFAQGAPSGMETVVAAMTSRPELVGGPQAVDSLVMRSLPGAVAKRGAEGVLCAGLPDGTGVALKVEDGAYRASYVAAGVVLGIPELAERPLHSSRGDVVGTIAVDA